MIGVFGHFRFPPDAVDQARARMREVIAATRAEPGCRAYAYAEDVTEPGLFRVTEMWNTREALDAHFATAHMKAWIEARVQLGF